MELLEQIKANAQKYSKRIVLPEGTEERTLKAAEVILSEGIAQLILLGKPEDILKQAEKLGLKNIEKATLIDPDSHAK